LTSAAAFHKGIYKIGLVRRLDQWLDATPHPPLAIEITPDSIAAARWSRTGGLDNFAVQPLPRGAIVPSAVEVNVVNSSAVRSVITSVCRQLKTREEEAALLLPDPVIRVFVQHFEEFPRKSEEALPMLRWKLKKSVPFEADETVLSYMLQSPRESGVDVVTGLARLRIIREYEGLAEGVGLLPGVILSSSLAALSLLSTQHATLLARISGAALTTAIVREGVLCGYRSTELPAYGPQLTPQMLLEEIFPLAAYYQDTWHDGIQSVLLAGLGDRLQEFIPPLEAEFHCRVRSLSRSVLSEGRIRENAHSLADRELDGLLGWSLHRD
jgi:type IV pilus assembly protein PilM